MRVRRANERGHVKTDWLDTRHTFSFGSYRDPAHMGYRALRVINDDSIAPASGFASHSHQDMEIVSYVIEGSLEHQDNMGNGSIIRPGDVQRMSAGTGVVHSEKNPSSDERVRLLQIWIEPLHRGTPPGYEQKHFPADEREGDFRLIVSQDGREGSVRLDADVSIYAGLLAPGEQAKVGLDDGRHAWIQIVSGEIALAGEKLGAGDGVAIDRPSALEIEAMERSEILVFDLA